MKTAAVIAEYNPFHSGHGYHIEKTKKEMSCPYWATAVCVLPEKEAALIFGKPSRK